MTKAVDLGRKAKKKKKKKKKMKYQDLCSVLILNAPIATKVVCFSRLPKCLRSLYGKQCGPRSDCSSVLGPHCLFLYLIRRNVMQLFATDDFSRRHFQMRFISLRLKG